MRRTNNNEKAKIVAVRKENGVISDFKLNNGEILNKKEAVKYAKTYGIDGVNVSKTRGSNPQEILRANPTDDPKKALMNMPNF